MVRAIILVRSPKKLIAARLRKVTSVSDSFPTSGQFDAVAIVDVQELSEIKEVAHQIQKITGVERTETMVEVQWKWFKELRGKITVNIKKVGNVILAVTDIDKSLEFYNGIIGLPIKNQRRSWVDLGTTGALLSLHPASLTAEHVGSSIDNGITIGFLVGDVQSAVDELKEKGVKIHRDIVEKDAGKNAVIVDPDGYLISLFEPIFGDKAEQTSGYQGFTPA